MLGSERNAGGQCACQRGTAHLSEALTPREQWGCRLLRHGGECSQVSQLLCIWPVLESVETGLDVERKRFCRAAIATLSIGAELPGHFRTAIS